MDATSKSAKRMQDYLQRKDLLKTFTDASEHSEAAVLDVLRKLANALNDFEDEDEILLAAATNGSISPGQSADALTTCRNSTGPKQL